MNAGRGGGVCEVVSYSYIDCHKYAGSHVGRDSDVLELRTVISYSATIS